MIHFEGGISQLKVGICPDALESWVLNTCTNLAFVPLQQVVQCQKMAGASLVVLIFLT